MKMTDAAVAQIKTILEKEKAKALRAYISGGGCAGFQYGFMLDEPAEDDHVIEQDGVMLLIDPMSFQYLEEAEIDYTTSLAGSQFVIRNPNAETTCGCGSSFAA